MIKKLFLKFLLGKNKDYLDITKINGIAYEVIVRPFVSPADRWIRLLEERKGE